MDSQFTFSFECLCGNVCDGMCGIEDRAYTYEVVGYACGGDDFDGSFTPCVVWDRVEVDSDDELLADDMECAMVQISEDIDAGIHQHFCSIDGEIYAIEWLFQNACTSRFRSKRTGKMVSEFNPSRLTITLVRLDSRRAAPYV